MRKLTMVLFLLIATTATLTAQDAAQQLKEAENVEKQFKEQSALDLYKQVAAAAPGNIKVLVKCTELNCSIGAKQADKNIKKTFYMSAKEYADKALATDTNNADANYAQALAFGKLTEVDDESKKVMEDVRSVKFFADKALALNPNHSRANYVLGKWHYEILNISWFKKAAMKTMYGGVPKTDIDTAISYMEKCRSLDPYFVANYLDLAKAYQYKNRPAQAIEVLTKMVRLPNRTADDAALKEEGKKMLESMQ